MNIIPITIYVKQNYITQATQSYKNIIDSQISLNPPYNKKTTTYSRIFFKNPSMEAKKERK